MYIYRNQNLISASDLIRSEDRFTNPSFFDSPPNNRSKISSSLVSAFNDPNLNLIEEKLFISNYLLAYGGNLFTDKEVKNLSLKLPYIFRQKEFSIRADGQKIIIAKNDNERDMVSIPRFLFSEDLLPLKLSDKEDAIYLLNDAWTKEFTLNSSSNSEELKLDLSKLKSRFGIYGVRLSYNEDTTHEEVAAINSIFELLPRSVFAMLRNGLSGGIHISSPELKGIGEYNHETKEIHLGKAKHFSVRGYLELILHEIGHACEEEFINDSRFIELYNKATNDMYKLPALDENGKRRQNYIKNDISEFFAETFMHYALQGNTLRSGFSGVASDHQLYREVYEYFKENVFGNYEYTGISGKLTKTLQYKLPIHHKLKDLLSSQALRFRIHKNNSI